MRLSCASRTAFAPLLALAVTASAFAAAPASAFLTHEEETFDGQLRPRLAGARDGTIAYVNSDGKQIVLTLAGRDEPAKQIAFSAPDVLDRQVAVSDKGVVTVAWETQVGQGDSGGGHTRAFDTSGKLLAATKRVLPPKGIRRSRFYLTSIAAGGDRTVLVTGSGVLDPFFVAVRNGAKPFGALQKTGYGEAVQVLPNGTDEPWGTPDRAALRVDALAPAQQPRRERAADPGEGRRRQLDLRRLQPAAHRPRQPRVELHHRGGGPRGGPAEVPVAPWPGAPTPVAPASRRSCGSGWSARAPRPTGRSSPGRRPPASPTSWRAARPARSPRSRASPTASSAWRS